MCVYRQTQHAADKPAVVWRHTDSPHLCGVPHPLEVHRQGARRHLLLGHACMRQHQQRQRPPALPSSEGDQQAVCPLLNMRAFTEHGRSAGGAPSMAGGPAAAPWRCCQEACRRRGSRKYFAAMRSATAFTCSACTRTCRRGQSRDWLQDRGTRGPGPAPAAPGTMAPPTAQPCSQRDKHRCGEHTSGRSVQSSSAMHRRSIGTCCARRTGSSWARGSRPPSSGLTAAVTSAMGSGPGKQHQRQGSSGVRHHSQPCGAGEQPPHPAAAAARPRLASSRSANGTSLCVRLGRRVAGQAPKLLLRRKPGPKWAMRTRRRGLQAVPADPGVPPDSACATHGASRDDAGTVACPDRPANPPGARGLHTPLSEIGALRGKGRGGGARLGHGGEAAQLLGEGRLLRDARCALAVHHQPVRPWRRPPPLAACVESPRKVVRGTRRHSAVLPDECSGLSVHRLTGGEGAAARRHSRARLCLGWTDVSSLDTLCHSMLGSQKALEHRHAQRTAANAGLHGQQVVPADTPLQHRRRHIPHVCYRMACTAVDGMRSWLEQRSLVSPAAAQTAS